jgi:hypothetical protein
MIDTLTSLISNTSYADAAAFALLFAAGVKLFLKSRHWATAVFSAGMGAALLSHVILIIAYQLFPVSYEHNVGIVPNQYREAVVWLSYVLSISGLVVGSLAFFLYVFRVAGHKNAT